MSVIHKMKQSNGETRCFPGASQPLTCLSDEHSGKHQSELPVISKAFISILLCSSYSSSFLCTLLANSWEMMACCFSALSSYIYNVGFWACFQITAPVWFFGSLFTSLLGCNKYLIWMWADNSVTKRSRDKKSLHAFTAQINTQGSDNQNHDCMPRRRWINNNSEIQTCIYGAGIIKLPPSTTIKDDIMS